MCNTNEDSIQPSQQNQTVVVNQSSSNGIGTAGFIMAVLGLVFSWVPIVNFILWILGPQIRNRPHKMTQRSKR